MIIVSLFIISFFLNLLWEVLHSTLYKTCWEMPFNKVQRLLVIMSLKDAFWIIFFFVLATLISNILLLSDTVQFAIFIILCLSFSFTDEKLAIKRKRWEYGKNMPRFLGVGLTPLLELALTGGVALYLGSLLNF